MGKRVYRLKKDEVDLRDKIYRSTTYKTLATLPTSVDLRPQMSPVVDQGQLGSCTANAIASGNMEFLMLKNKKKLTPLSRLWLYYQERKLEGTISEDDGASIRDGMKIAVNLGCATESDWAYIISKFAVTPPVTADQDALNYKMVEYHSVADLNSLKVCLAEGYPVVIGIEVYPSFESDTVAKTGKVPLPKKGEKCLGGHALLAVGYKKIGNTKYVIIRNSWNDTWADNGYGYLPESYFKKYVSDMWTGR